MSSRRRSRAAAVAVAVAFAVLLGSVALATPAAAQERPANMTRSGPNLTLVVANCERPPDVTVALDLASNSRNAAAACLGIDGVSPELAALIADYAPDRVMVVGGPAAVPSAVMEELLAAVRSAYRWTVIQRLGGGTRADTAAEAARVGLDTPERVGAGTITLIVADGWNDADLDTARAFAAGFQDAAIAYFSPATASDGLPQATAELIVDYRPARIVFAGRADRAGLAAETATEAVLKSIGSAVPVERVALAGAAPAPGVEVAALTSTAREIFAAISAYLRVPARFDESTAPFLALDLPYLDDPDLYGDFLWTLRADGTDRTFRAPHDHGWGWLSATGEFYWTGPAAPTMDLSVDASDAFVGTADGTQRRQVRAGADWINWSPAEDRFAFFEAEDRDGDNYIDYVELFVTDADGGDPKAFGQVGTDTVSLSIWRDQLWSPDGGYLAYDSERVDPETMETVHTVHLRRADAGEPPVSLGEGMHFRSWSPDGQRVAYGDRRDCDGDEKPDSFELWIADRDLSGARSLGWIDGHSQWSGQLWSPDGKRIAVDQVDPQDCSVDLRVHDAAGELDAVTIAEDAHVLAWSPNSDALAFAMGAAEGGGRPDDPEGWLTVCVCPTARRLGDLRQSGVYWSPGGDWLAYTEVIRNDRGAVQRLDARVERVDGTGARVFEPHGSVLRWSPDGSRIAYTALYDDDGDGRRERRALRLYTPGAGGDDAYATLVHDLPQRVWSLRWSPGGDYVAYASGSYREYVRWWRGERDSLSLWTVATQDPEFAYRLASDFDRMRWQPESDPE